jgi:hypothetical protein
VRLLNIWSVGNDAPLTADYQYWNGDAYDPFVENYRTVAMGIPVIMPVHFPSTCAVVEYNCDLPQLIIRRSYIMQVHSGIYPMVIAFLDAVAVAALRGKLPRLWRDLLMHILELYVR